MKFLLLPAFSRQSKEHKHIRRRVKHCITCKCTHRIRYDAPRRRYCCKSQLLNPFQLAHKHCNKLSQIQHQSRNPKKYHMLYIFISWSVCPRKHCTGILIIKLFWSVSYNRTFWNHFKACLP